MRSVLFAVTLCGLTAAPLRAQDSLHVAAGSPLVEGAKVRAGVDTFQLVVRQPGGEERLVSTLVRTVERASAGAEPAWRIVQSYHSPRGDNVDTSLVRAEDLAPLTYVAVLNDAEQRFRFEGSSVRGVVSPRDSATREVRHDFAEPPYNAVVDEDVIRALPLAPGLVATIVAYNPPWPPAPQLAVIRVTGTATIRTAAGPVEAWEISYEAGGAPTTLWLAREDGRLLRLRSSLRRGASFWKIPVRDLEAWRAEQ